MEMRVVEKHACSFETPGRPKSFDWLIPAFRHLQATNQFLPLIGQFGDGTTRISSLKYYPAALRHRHGQGLRGSNVGSWSSCMEKRIGR